MAALKWQQSLASRLAPKARDVSCRPAASCAEPPAGKPGSRYRATSGLPRMPLVQFGAEAELLKDRQGPQMQRERVRVMRATPEAQAQVVRAESDAPADGLSSTEYNQKMQREMKNPYEYHHELGMYYTRITSNLIVGSQPQSPSDIDRLHDNEGVTCILNLQQDHDIQYWNIDIASITNRCHELGIEHHRRPARDFDPNSLRNGLPGMVAIIEAGVAKGQTVFVHCTAGLGRAPGAAIAYLFWFSDPPMDLESAYSFLVAKRPCGPKKDAIRGATYDLAKNDPNKEPFEQLPDYAFTGLADWERDLIRQRVRSLA